MFFLGCLQPSCLDFCCHNAKLKNYFLQVRMAAKTVIKKKQEMVKEELLNSLRENDEAEKAEINTANITDLIERIELIKHYEEITQTQHKQREILKKFKETEENFFDNAQQSRSMIYSKTGVYKYLKKPGLKNKIKAIESVCKNYLQLFSI